MEKRMIEIWEKAYGKINLAIDILRKREDGYHEVDMIMQSVQLYDTVHLQRKDKGGIFLDTNLSFLPKDSRNLAYRAAQLMMDTYDLPPHIGIYIKKMIPVAAGMAGGSSNAAAVIRGMNRLYQLNRPLEELQVLGKKLGADVPFCLAQGCYRAQGIGEILSPVPSLPSVDILLVKPKISVSTKEVYENLILEERKADKVKALIQGLEKGDIEEIGPYMINGLEKVTMAWHPEIGEIKEKMLQLGARWAMMSGSGPTVFGIYTDPVQGAKSLEVFREEKDGGRFI